MSTSIKGVVLSQTADRYKDVTTPHYVDITVPLCHKYTFCTDGTILTDTPPFGVQFVDLTKGDPPLKIIWNNPNACSVIKPFIKPNCDEFKNLFFAANYPVNHQTGKDGQLGKMFSLDPFVKSLCMLDLKDLANFSQTSICCYYAAKAEVIWDKQFVKFFSKVNPLPHLPRKLLPKGDGVINIKVVSLFFSKEWQFKIYFKRMIDELKIYKEQFNHNQEIYDVHMDLYGWNYNGSEESIDPKSQQGRCLYAINHGVLEMFNDQTKFNAMIYRAQIFHGNLPRKTHDPFREASDFF